MILFHVLYFGYYDQNMCLVPYHLYYFIILNFKIPAKILNRNKAFT